MQHSRAPLAMPILAAVAASSLFLAASPLRAQADSQYVTRTEGRLVLDAQKMLDDAVAAGRKKVTLPPGRFHLAGKGARLVNLEGFTLEGAGPEKTVLVADWRQLALGVGQCRDVTLRNFAIDCDPVPYVQATITGMTDLDNGLVAMDFRVHKGYPGLTKRVMKHMHGCGQFFDQKTRRLTRHHHWFGPLPGRNVLRIDDMHGRLVLAKGWKNPDRAKVGDYVVLPTGQALPCAISYSDGVRMEDVAIYASSSIALGARFLTGDNYFRFTIKPGPPPPGAAEPRLLSTNADGVQYFWCSGSATFEGCDFGFMGDDGINMSGLGLYVVKVESPTRWIAASRLHFSYIKHLASASKPGDVVRPLRYGTFEPLGDLPIKSVVFQGQKPAELTETIKQRCQWIASRPEWAYVAVEAARPPKAPVEVGDVLSFRAFLPDRFAIRNSRFHDTRARGLLIMASNGVIENNTIEHAALAGIQICHELPNGAPDWVSNLVVRNNTIRDTCFDDDITQYWASNQLAALMVCNRPIAIREPLGSYPWLAGHRNIRLVGNTIEGSDVAGILANGLDGGEVRGNVVRRVNLRGGRDVGAKVGLSVPYAITLMNSRNVAVSGNRVSDLGPGAEAAVGDLGVYPKPQK